MYYTSSVTVRLTEAEVKLLDELVEKWKVSRSVVIRRLLRRRRKRKNDNTITAHRMGKGESSG